jgi:hypothetical protein
MATLLSQVMFHVKHARCHRGVANSSGPPARGCALLHPRDQRRRFPDVSRETWWPRVLPAPQCGAHSSTCPMLRAAPWMATPPFRFYDSAAPGPRPLSFLDKQWRECHPRPRSVRRRLAAAGGRSAWCPSWRRGPSPQAATDEQSRRSISIRRSSAERGQRMAKRRPIGEPDPTAHADGRWYEQRPMYRGRRRRSARPTTDGHPAPDEGRDRWAIERRPIGRGATEVQSADRAMGTRHASAGGSR